MGEGVGEVIIIVCGLVEFHSPFSRRRRVSFWPTLAQRLSAHTGRHFESGVVEPVAGGCIHRAFAIQGHDALRYFVKLNEAALLPTFEAEADGLRELANAQALRVPQPVFTGAAEGQA